MPVGPAARWTIIALAASLSSTLVALSYTAGASAAGRTFSPIAKTPDALVFRLDEVEPASVRGAKARLRQRGGKLRRKKLRVAKVRRAAARGKLRLRRGSDGEPRVTGGTVKVKQRPAKDAYTVPASVPSGCSADATSQILAWIANVPNGATLRFGADGCYRIDRTLELRRRNLIFDGNGSTFRSVEPPSSESALWRAWDSTVSFRNMTILGSYANGGTFTGELEWAHGIDLRGTEAVIENVSMRDLAGDCVYFGLGASRSSGAVRASSCTRTGRNAVSVTAGDDIRVEHMTTDRIGYVVFDVEPNTGAGHGSSRVTFDSNTIGSYYMKAYTVIGNAPVASQAFTNNRIVGQGLEIGAVNASHRPRRVKISGNSSDTPAKHNTLNLEGVDSLTITKNTVPLVSGATMAQVRYSCDVNVSGNSYPGGSREASISELRC